MTIKTEKTQLEKLVVENFTQKNVELVGMRFEECLGNKLNEDKDSLKVIKFSLW